ncbi:MAG: type II toxin-antitoxin system MqsA family antitoxin [Candidatus Hydrogenedentota bacterium]
MSDELCSMCGKAGVRNRLLTKSYGKGDSLIVIEDVPVSTCSHCGESYMTTQTLRKIEDIRQNRAHLATQRSVPVATFS